MGNCCCWGSQVNHHQSPNLTKITSPENGNENQTSSPRKSTQHGGGGEGGELNAPVSRHPREAVARETAARVTAPIIPRMYTLSEMKSVTNNFRPDSVLGQGGFGTVFRGWVDGKTLAPAKIGAGVPVAVKRSNPDSEQGLQEWQSEVKFLGKFSHPNLVRLLGYCWEDKQFLLMYEYMQKGSLENHLFRKVPDPISWDLRLKIAIGAARGLDFLHTSEKSVIYRDFKSSNILLDTDYNAKLSDFGLAKFGPVNGDSHVTTRIMGTYGYAAPEYVATGHLYVRSDVYGFGVVLLEMLTGLPALDMNRPGGQHILVDWARPSLTDKKKLKRIVDPKLEGRYPIKAALQAGELILKCLEGDPKNRPCMDEVLATLEAIRTVNRKPTETKPPKDEASSSSSGNRRHNNNRSPMHGKAYQYRPRSSGR